MKKEEFWQILSAHQLWQTSQGQAGARANLTDAILSADVNLKGATLIGTEMPSGFEGKNSQMHSHPQGA
jgi:uncharacterized protein YjbI with pentapeptide repeats